MDILTAIMLPPLIRACLFDLDGVLTKTAQLHAMAWKQVFDSYLRQWSEKEKKFYVPFDLVRDYNTYVDGKPRLVGAQSFLESRKVSNDSNNILHLADHLAQLKDTLFFKLLQRHPVEVYSGSIRYVQEVLKAGLATAVVSSSTHCSQILASAQITNLFQCRIDGNTAAERHLKGKPSPDTYLAAAHNLGIPPTQAAVFEDALSGVEAGRSGHFGYVVGIDRRGQREALRIHGADIVVNDLSELLTSLAT